MTLAEVVYAYNVLNPGAALRQTTDGWRGPCIVCGGSEQATKFRVTQSGYYQCFSCTVSGDFASRVGITTSRFVVGGIHKKTVVDMQPTYEAMSRVVDNPTVCAYIQHRGLDSVVVDRFARSTTVGVAVPIYQGDVVVGIQQRSIASTNRFVMVKGSCSAGVFYSGHYNAPRAIVVEGMFDYLTAASTWGHNSLVVGMVSASTAKHVIPVLTDYRGSVTVLAHPDDAGIKAAKTVASQGADIIVLENDLNAQLIKGGNKCLSSAIPL